MARKKIYDIQPPKVANKKEGLKQISKEILDSSKSRRKAQPHVQKAQAPQEHHKKEVRSIWWPVSVCVVAVVLAAGVYLFFKLPKAEVTIWPKIDTLSFKQTITADKKITSVDFAKAVIPAQYFQATKTNSQDFPATGNASNEGQASGTITIFNKYNPPMPFTFRAGTRFMSDSGKLFIAPQKVVIPAAKKTGSKITPGSVQVKVQAVEGGTSYNIPPASFSVPGLKGTSYYYSIYATSDSAMTGGYSGKVKKVTDDDIQGAKDVLSQKTLSDAEADLRSQISSDYVLLSTAIVSNVTSASTTTKAGAVAENFNYKVTATANALAFKKSDLEQFVKNYINSKTPEGKTILEDTLKIDYSSNVIDISGGKATLNLDFSSGVYQSINRNSMALSFLGENSSQIKKTIDNTLGDQASKFEIKFWPFWVKSAPNNQKAVEVELKFQ